MCWVEILTYVLFDVSCEKMTTFDLRGPNKIQTSLLMIMSLCVPCCVLCFYFCLCVLLGTSKSLCLGVFDVKQFYVHPQL